METVWRWTFYDIENSVSEGKTLRQTELSEDETEVRQKLQDVLDSMDE